MASPSPFLPMPDLYALARQFRGELLAGERAAADALITAYGRSWARIKNQLDALLREIEAAKTRGEVVNGAWLRRRDRLQALLGDTERELNLFAQAASERIRQEQQAAVLAGAEHAKKLVEATTDPAGVTVTWNRLPSEAVRDLVGFTSNGTPLRALFDELGPRASEQIRDALVQGVSLGKNPRAIATEIREALGGDLTRARLIARTEVLRSYRESSIRGMRENADVVERWRWTASRTTRTCAMCLAMDGQEFPLDTPFGSHPQCRCTPVPVTKSYAELLGDPTIPDDRPKRDTGPEWFAKLPEKDQAKILGPGKFELYQEGKLKLADLVGHRHDQKWGEVRWERSLKAVREAEARRGLGLLDAEGDPGAPTDASKTSPAAMDARLAKLPTEQRRIWGDPKERHRVFWGALEAAEAGEAGRAAALAAEIDGAAMAGLEALGYVSSQERAITIGTTPGALRALPPNEIRFDTLLLRKRLQDADRGPDDVFRAWLQETVHTRHLIPDDYRQEYGPVRGYEEGLAEGIARQAVRAAGLATPGNREYDRYVTAYEGLAQALGVEPQQVYQAAWDHPAGRVRSGFPRLVAELAGKDPEPEFAEQILVTGDRLFASKRSEQTSDEAALRDLWRAALE